MNSSTRKISKRCNTVVLCWDVRHNGPHVRTNANDQIQIVLLHKNVTGRLRGYTHIGRHADPQGERYGVMGDVAAVALHSL